MRGGRALAAAALLAGALAGAPAALATHDSGARYSVIAVADAGRFLVARCELTMSEPPDLLVLDARGAVRATVARGLAPPLGDVVCQGAEPAWAALLEDADLSAALAPHRLRGPPVAGPWSPSRARYLLVGLHGEGAEVQLLDGGRIARRQAIPARAGFSPYRVDVAPLWHPDGRWAVVAGARIGRVTLGVQHWRPYLHAWKLTPSVTSPSDVAAAWVDWGERQLRSCRRKSAGCEGADLAFRRALELDPEHADAQRGLESVEALLR